MLLRGALMGFSLAAPIGPVGMMVMGRTLRAGRAAGMASGVGVALADGLYCLLGSLGLTLLTRFLSEQHTLLRLGAGVLLIVLGWRAARSAQQAPAPVQAPDAVGAHSVVKAAVSMFAITLGNPLTILTFAALGAGAGISGVAPGSPVQLGFVAGVALGSLAWWLVLSTLTAALRGRISAVWMGRINLAMGVLIIAFGVSIILFM